MTPFMVKVRTLANVAQPSGPADSVDIGIGRTFATEFMDALRSPYDVHPEWLAYAIALAGRAGDQVLRGFLLELAEEIKEPA